MNVSSIWLPIWSVAFVGGVSLLAVCTLERLPRQLQTILPFLTAMGAGALLGDSIGHLLPEAFASHRSSRASALTFVCTVLLLAALQNRRKPQSGVSVIIAGNFIHNLVDGVLIGTSFLLGAKAGLLSTLAILLHEIPHELGIFGIIVRGGMRPRRAVMVNAVSAVLAISGTLLALMLGSMSSSYASATEPAVAGVFIYIACADLLPEITEQEPLIRSIQVLIALSSAVLLIWLD